MRTWRRTQSSPLTAVSISQTCGLQVTCVGHVIGAIVADTKPQAQRAVKAVKIIYEELPKILTIEVFVSAKVEFSFDNNVPV